MNLQGSVRRLQAVFRRTWEDGAYAEKGSDTAT